MKGWFILFFLPFLATAQTIHFDGDEILHEGTIKRQAAGSAGLKNLSHHVVKSALKEADVKVVEVKKNIISAKGFIQLETPYQFIRRLHFTLSLREKIDGFAYRIDSVFIMEQQRGSRSIIINSKKILDDRELTGAAAAANERLLNEIDMNLQKVIAVLRRAVQNSEKR